MVDINLSKAVRSNLGSLQNTAALMSKTSDRLSTGNKVNSALDNPTNFFTASALNSRAGDLNNLMDSMANGIKTIEAADNGLTAITKNLESMQSTLRQARQDKSFETESYSLNRLDPSSNGKMVFSGGAFGASAELNISERGTGQFKEVAFSSLAPTAAAKSKLASGPALNNATLTAGKLNIDYNGKSVQLDIAEATVAGDRTTTVRDAINTAIAGSGLAGLVTATVGTTGGDANKIVLEAVNNEDGQIKVSGTSATQIFGSATADGSQGSDAKTTFTVNGTTVELDSVTGANATAAATETNRALAAAGSKFAAYVDGSNFGIRATTADAGSLSIGGAEARHFGTPSPAGLVSGQSSANLTLAKSVDTLVGEINSRADLKSNVKASNDNGKLRIQNLSTSELNIRGANGNGEITGRTTGSNAVESNIKGNSVREDLAKQFNELRDQLDKLADDASFNGINLLRGDNLKLTFNETGTSSIDIQTKDGSSVNAANLNLETTLEARDLDSDDGIDGFIADIKSALDTVRSQSSAFGSNLSIVQNRQDFTKSMINTLETGAGNLTLADMNQEAANMMALQTRQSLASSTLSMANQADQGVLQLLR